MDLQRRLSAAAFALLTVVWTVGVTASEGSSAEPVCGRAFTGNEWDWGKRWGDSPPGCDPDKDWNDDGRPERWFAYQPATETSGSERFKIWYSEGQAEAEAAAPTLLELFGRYQDPVKELFGRRIPSDADCPCNGGDGRIDIYLLPVQKPPAFDHIPFLAEATGFPVGGGCSQPSYFRLHHSYLDCSAALLGPLVVHELTHLVQYSYDIGPPCGKESSVVDETLGAWIEGTAVWGQWAVFGGNPFLPKFSQDVCRPNVAFADEYLLNLLRDPLTKHPYPAFTFPLFLSTHYDPAIVPKVWESLEGLEGADRLARALERTVDLFAGADVWDETWADFSAANFNVPPVDEYARHEILTEGKRETVQLGPTSGTVPLPSPEIQPLAANHYEIAVGEGVRTLIFETGVGDEPPENLRIQALPRTAGGTRSLQD